MAETPALADVRVLVTRPAHQADGLCRLIEREGGSAIRFPTIEIVPVSDPAALEQLIDRLHEFDLAIFISPNAVQHALSQIRARRGALPPQLTVACVGSASAATLAQFGVRPSLVPTAHADSEGLLALPTLQQVTGQRIVIFRGQGGREHLADTLRTRGATVEYAECYVGSPGTELEFAL